MKFATLAFALGLAQAQNIFEEEDAEDLQFGVCRKYCGGWNMVCLAKCKLKQGGCMAQCGGNYKDANTWACWGNCLSKEEEEEDVEDLQFRMSADLKNKIKTDVQACVRQNCMQDFSKIMQCSMDCARKVAKKYMPQFQMPHEDFEEEDAEDLQFGVCRKYCGGWNMMCLAKCKLKQGGCMAQCGGNYKDANTWNCWAGCLSKEEEEDVEDLQFRLNPYYKMKTDVQACVRQNCMKDFSKIAQCSMDCARKVAKKYMPQFQMPHEDFDVEEELTQFAVIEHAEMMEKELMKKIMSGELNEEELEAALEELSWWSDAKDKAKAAWRAAKEKAAALKDKIKDGAGKLGEKIKDGAEKLKDKAGDLKDKMKDKLADMKEKWDKKKGEPEFDMDDEDLDFFM